MVPSRVMRVWYRAGGSVPFSAGFCCFHSMNALGRLKVGNDGEMRLLAARSSARSFTSLVNDYMQECGRKYEKLTRTLQEEGSPLELDYTEPSLYLADFILSLVFASPDSEMMQPLLREVRVIREPQDYLLTSGYFYAAEVSTRCLGTQWTTRKGFLSGTQIGLKLPDGSFFSEAEIRGGTGKPMMPREMYLLKLKPRVAR